MLPVPPVAPTERCSTSSPTPLATTNYSVEVRCSSDPACADSVTLAVTVDCPSSGNLGGFPDVLATDKSTLSWSTSLAYDYAEGDLAGVSTYATNATGTAPAGTSYSMGSIGVGQGFYYVFRQPGPLGGGSLACNDPGNTWSSGGGSESSTPGRDNVLP